MSAKEDAVFLQAVYERLSSHYDLDRWHWRPETPALDICLGAVLVQHTAWTNVERALANLRDAHCLALEALAALPESELALLLRPAGTPLTKARRVRALVELVGSHGGFEGLFALPLPALREALLATHGVGPETADVILLYAARRPVIVHDAYTTRLLRRLGTGPEGERYDTWRGWLHSRLPDALEARQRFHAGIVVHCKETCRAKPRCGACPLVELCAFAAASMPVRA